MLARILATITGLGSAMARVVGKIYDLKIAQLKAASGDERAEIERQITEIEGRKAVLIAESGMRLAGFMNASVRFAYGVAGAAIILKLLVWDKVIGSFVGCSGPKAISLTSCQTFRTDPLDVYQWSVITAMVAFYFMYDMYRNKQK